jgi:hypothetical protein
MLNDILLELLKLIPGYVLFGLVALWILVKALPDSAQFFVDFLPNRRRQLRALVLLDVIKAKSEAFEIARKHDIQPPLTLEAAIKGELAALLGGQAPKLPPPIKGTTGKTAAETLFSLVVSALVVLAVLGLASKTKDFKFERIFLVPLAISFVAAMVGCYGARRLAVGERLSFIYFIMASFLGFMAGLMGILIGTAITDGVILALRL